MIPKDRLERWKAILKIAWPLIIANSFWNLQLTIDRMFLGNYSIEALGAAMAVMGVFWTPMALLQQTSAYLTTFVAQYFGAKQPEMIGPATWQSIYIATVGGLLFFLLIPFSDPFFELIGHSEKVRGLEVTYFDALVYSALPTALIATASGFFTGLGTTKVIMQINGVGLLANAFFDYLFIFGNCGFPAMGIAGAGYATALAGWAGAIYGFVLVFQKKYEIAYGVRSRFQVQWDLIRRYIKFGLPAGMQWALEGLAFTVFLIFVGRMENGDAALAGSGIAVTIMMLAILPPLGVAQAVSAMLGQHLGNNDPQSAEEMTWSGVQVSLIFIMTMGMTYILFPEFYLGWFHNPSDPALWTEVEFMVPFLLMFVAAFTCFDSMNLVFSFALKGAGDTRFVSLVALMVPWPLMVLPTYLVQHWQGAIYWAWGAASLFGITQALIFLRRFQGGKWKAMRVI